MSGRYASLGLDDILEITRVDANHSDELREQGKGLKALSDKLNESLESMTTSRTGIESGFGGASAEALFEKVTDLVRKGAKGHGRLVGQPDVFFNLAEQSNITHRRMVELREERDKELEAAKPPERPGIREDYDEQARQYMRTTTAGYVESVRGLEPTKPYGGPRIPRDADVNGPEGIVDHSTPGPSLGPTLHETGPKSHETGPQLHESGPRLQGNTGLIGPETIQNHNMGNGPGTGQLRYQTWSDIGTAGFGPRGRSSQKSKKKKKQSKRDRENGTGDGPIKRDVLPPVIGGRGEPEMAAAPTSEPSSPPTPRADGVVAPVIGAREAALPMETAQPLPRHDGLLPPVIGGRTMPMPGPRTVPNPEAAPPRPEPPRRRFTTTAAGVRAVRPDYPAEGKVIRGGTEAAGGHKPTEAEYTRQARTVHGDTDNPNRAVIRNSRAFTEPPATETPAAEPVRASRRRSEPEETEFETGPFITNYNLGRSQ